MKHRVMFVILVGAHLVQFAYGIFNEVFASQYAQYQQSPITTQTTSAKQYKLGETIRLRDGLTLKVVRGSTKSIELFASKLGAGERSLIIDLEFEASKPIAGEDPPFLKTMPSEDADKSDILLQAGEEKIAPTGGALFLPDTSVEPVVGRTTSLILNPKTGKRYSLVDLKEGKTTHSLLFELKGDQLNQKKKMILIFRIKPLKTGPGELPEDLHSFVIELDSNN